MMSVWQRLMLCHNSADLKETHVRSSGSRREGVLLLLVYVFLFAQRCVRMALTVTGSHATKHHCHTRDGSLDFRSRAPADAEALSRS